jgi:hypothetical protein
MLGDFLRALSAEAAAVLLAPSFVPAAIVPAAQLSVASKFSEFEELTF